MTTHLPTSHVNAGAATDADVLQLNVAGGRREAAARRGPRATGEDELGLALAMGYTAQNADIELLETTTLEARRLCQVSDPEAQHFAAAGRPEIWRARNRDAAPVAHRSAAGAPSVLV